MTYSTGFENGENVETDIDYESLICDNIKRVTFFFLKPSLKFCDFIGLQTRLLCFCYFSRGSPSDHTCKIVLNSDL